MRVTPLILAASLFAIPSLIARQDSPPPEDPQSKHERELRMPEIVRAMDLGPGATAADIGAGDGEYEPALSRAVGPRGRIFAEDISPFALKQLRKRISKDRIANVKVIQGVPDDPRLPAGELDAVLMVIAYHEVKEYQTMLDHVFAALKPGGRFVIVDMSPHKTATRPRADQVKNHVIAADIAEAEVRHAGFEMASRDDRFIDHPDEESTRWMIVFRKPM